jgi:hypothetical protein
VPFSRGSQDEFGPFLLRAQARDAEPMASAFLCLQLAQTINFGPGVAATGTGSSAVATHLQCVKSLAADEAERLRRRVLPNVHFWMNSVDKASQTAASPPSGSAVSAHVSRAARPSWRFAGETAMCRGPQERPAPRDWPGLGNSTLIGRRRGSSAPRSSPS